MKLCNSSHWFFLPNFLTDLPIRRSGVQEILQKVLSTSHRTAPQWRNNKRPFSTHLLRGFLSLSIPSQHLPSSSYLCWKHGLVLHVPVLPRMNKLSFQMLFKMSSVPSPTEASQRLQKLFCISINSTFFAQALKWKLSFLAKAFILRKFLCVFNIAQNYGKTKKKEIGQMGTRLKREVLSLFCLKCLTYFIYYTCLTNICYMKTNPSLFLLTELIKENCYP